MRHPQVRSFVTSGIALASAVTIVATAPAVISESGLAAPTLRQPLTRWTDSVELTALADITIKGITDAYWSGWGGYIGPVNGKPDEYFPNINPTGTSRVYLTGAPGVAYYVIDQTLDQFASVNLDNYFFEAGAYYGTGKNTTGSAVGALIYVGSSELFGAKSPIAQLAKAVFYYGIPALVKSTIVGLAQLVPTASIGPVKVGGGILASLYFTGQTPDGKYSFGSPGLSAVLGYIATSVSDALPKRLPALRSTVTPDPTPPASSGSHTGSATTAPAGSDADTPPTSIAVAQSATAESVDITHKQATSRTAHDTTPDPNADSAAGNTGDTAATQKQPSATSKPTPTAPDTSPRPAAPPNQPTQSGAAASERRATANTPRRTENTSEASNSGAESISTKHTAGVGAGSRPETTGEPAHNAAGRVTATTGGASGGSRGEG